MTTKRWMAIIAGGGVALAAAALWFFFFRDTSPPPLNLEDAVASATTTPGAATTVAGEDSPAEPVATAAVDDQVQAGEWTVDPEGSVVGYRIEEELAGIGGNTAVGRTSELTGSVTIEGASITAVSVVVDMAALVSDDSRRDNQLRNRGLQTSQFPEASFVLDTPIALSSVPEVGERITATANGTLTVHGVSRSVELDLEAQLVDPSTIVVVGGTDIVLADYGIEPPVGFNILSVADNGLIEFQLTFRL